MSSRKEQRFSKKKPECTPVTTDVNVPEGMFDDEPSNYIYILPGKMLVCPGCGWATNSIAGIDKHFTGNTKAHACPDFAQKFPYWISLDAVDKDSGKILKGTRSKNTWGRTA